MLHASQSVTVTLADGVATLALGFPGSPVNAIDLPRLREFGAAVEAVGRCPHVEVLVVRSAKPAGFCGGFAPGLAGHLAAEADRDVFARAGQEILARLAALPFVTVAYLEGPCLGPGVEIAAACDYRYAVTGPDAWFGLPPGSPACWGVTRLPATPPITAREACRAGLLDDAFCGRRAGIELQRHVDRLLRGAPKRAPLAPAATLAERRRAFRHSTPSDWPQAAGWPAEDVGVVAGDRGCLTTAVEVALRGRRAVVLSADGDSMGLARGIVAALLAEAVRRGRVTPLEAEQAARRVTQTLDAAELAPLRHVVTARREALRTVRLSPWATLGVNGVTLPPVARAAPRSLAS